MRSPTLYYPHMSLHWCHNGCDGISNHQSHNCLLNRFKHRSKKTSKLCITGLCVGNSPVTGEFPEQMASNVENVSIWWRHHVTCNLLACYSRFVTLPIHFLKSLSTLCMQSYIGTNTLPSTILITKIKMFSLTYISGSIITQWHFLYGAEFMKYWHFRFIVSRNVFTFVKASKAYGCARYFFWRGGLLSQCKLP